MSQVFPRAPPFRPCSIWMSNHQVVAWIVSCHWKPGKDFTGHRDASSYGRTCGVLHCIGHAAPGHTGFRANDTASHDVKGTLQRKRSLCCCVPHRCSRHDPFPRCLVRNVFIYLEVWARIINDQYRVIISAMARSSLVLAVFPETFPFASRLNDLSEALSRSTVSCSLGNV